MNLNIAPFLLVKETKEKGKGVFTTQAIPPMETIETSSVLVMNAKERILLDQTALHDYIFEWGNDSEQCCIAWGYVSLYNHSYESNCEYEMDFEEEVIKIKTMRSIEAGEELTINYNGDFDKKSPVWFEAK